MKERHYWTQYANTSGDLDDLVNERIGEGWEPYGPPYVAIQDGKDTLFCQAMTRNRPRAQGMSEQIRAELEG